MRLPKELVILLVLLAVMVIGVSWYVVDRRAKMKADRAAPPVAAPVSTAVTTAGMLFSGRYEASGPP